MRTWSRPRPRTPMTAIWMRSLGLSAALAAVRALRLAVAAVAVRKPRRCKDGMAVLKGEVRRSAEKRRELSIPRSCALDESKLDRGAAVCVGGFLVFLPSPLGGEGSGVRGM